MLKFLHSLRNFDLGIFHLELEGFSLKDCLGVSQSNYQRITKLWRGAENPSNQHKHFEEHTSETAT